MRGGTGVVCRVDRWRPEPSGKNLAPTSVPLVRHVGVPRVGDGRSGRPTTGRVGRPERDGRAALPTATPCARLHARTISLEWGLGELADTVELVVSELVTNAVLASVDHDGRPRYSAEHGLACVHLRLSTDGLAALIEVWDENTRPPTPVQSGLADEVAAASCWSMP